MNILRDPVIFIIRYMKLMLHLRTDSAATTSSSSRVI